MRLLQYCPRVYALLLPVCLVLLPTCSQGTEAELEDTSLPPLVAPSYETMGIRVATLNTHFLFDGTGNEGQAEFEHKNDPAAAARHRRAIGKVLRALDADVIVVQEVENAEVMQAVVSESLAGLGFKVHFVEGRDTNTGQDVAVLSRLPVQGTGRTDERVVYEADKTQGVSKNIWIHLKLAGRDATIIGLHLLAQPLNQSRKAEREAQAEVIRLLVESEVKTGREVMVVGDLNDFDDELPDAEGNEPISRVLATLKKASPSPADDLLNAMARAPRSERFTSFNDENDNNQADPGERSAVDHILLSPGLYGRISEVDYVQAYPLGTYSDHLPVVVTLQP